MNESETIRVSVEEAATLLGIEKGSVKKRIQRGKLRSEKDASGTIWVYLDRSETVRDQSQGQSATDRDELVSELRDRVRSLERRLDEERESRKRADTIIVQLSRANEEQARTIRELEAPQEPAEDAETAAAPTSELGELREELDTEQARREMAESTLHEGMAEEQRRREEAERERDELRQELYALREPRQSPETVEEQQGRGEPRPATGEAQEGVQRPWWRRVFGG
jgi:chromosome segregation ATPase